MWTKNDITDQTGKTVIITGANTGIGFEIAKALYEAGAHVIIASRDAVKIKNAAELIVEQGGKGTIETGILNLNSLFEVKQFAIPFKKSHATAFTH